MKKYIFILLTIFIFLCSCLSIKINYIIEKLVEYDDIDFNRIKQINIISNNKNLGLALQNYILKYYRNRNLQHPDIKLLDKPKDSIGNEINFLVNLESYKITEGWKIDFKEPIKKQKGGYIVFHNNVKFWKQIDATIDLTIYRQFENEKKVEIKKNLTYIYENEDAYIKEYKDLSQSIDKNLKIPPPNEIAKNNLKEITEYTLFSGLMDDLLKNFLSLRLQPISKEYINFKFLLNDNFFYLYNLLKQNRLEDALIIWEEIFSDQENPSYERSVAAYNIAIMKILNKDYESASLYFNWSEELEKESFQEIKKF